MKFKTGDRVRKTKGSEWEGVVVGTYSTELTPEGYAVESCAHANSVQIYPATALEIAPAGAVDGISHGQAAGSDAWMDLHLLDRLDVDSDDELRVQQIEEIVRRIGAALSQQTEPACSVCNGDCGAANPPVMNCPQHESAPAQDEKAEFEAAYQAVVDNGWTSVKHMARQVWSIARATRPAPAESACSVCNGFGKELTVYEGGIPCRSCQPEPAPAQDEREAFEAHLVAHHGFQPNTLRSLREGDSYPGVSLPLAWSVWQARPAQTEQQPVAWVHPNYLRDNALGFEASQCRLSPLQVPLYTIPIAQTAPQPEQTALAVQLYPLLVEWKPKSRKEMDAKNTAAMKVMAALSAQGESHEQGIG